MSMRLVAVALSFAALALACRGNPSAPTDSDVAPQLAPAATPRAAEIARQPSDEIVAAMLEAAGRPPPTPTLDELLAQLSGPRRIYLDDAERLGIGLLKSLPESLRAGASPMSRAAAQRAWTGWIANSRLLVIDRGYRQLEQYCGDGTRTVLVPASESGETSVWGVAVNPGSRWNVATLTFDVQQPFEPEYLAAPARILLDPSHLSARGNLLRSSDTAELLFFETEGCGA